MYSYLISAATGLKILDGDGSVQPWVAGLINLAHAAGTGLRDNFVGAEFLARLQTMLLQHNDIWRNTIQRQMILPLLPWQIDNGPYLIH